MFSLFLSLSISQHWAVIMAGSHGFRNYRHQSDAYQMYQILVGRGFSKDRVILMSYDDVASAYDNPYPGKVFNIRKHVNVRPDTKEIKYRGNNVTADNLFRVLTGNKSHGMPVLESTAEDDVYFYYNDHGMQGFLCVPEGRQIVAPELRQAIEKMIEKKMFRRLFILIEACYSGSVAKEMRGLENVAVITAANGIQSSFSHGYDESIQTFRTNEWTNHLMRFILAHPNSTVGRLFNYTKMLTFGSDVRFYGDKKMFGFPIKEFLGEAEPVKVNFENAELYHSSPEIDQMKTSMEFLRERMARSKTDMERDIYVQLQMEEKLRREQSKKTFDGIVLPLSGHNAKDLQRGKIPKNPKWDCYSESVEAFRKHCGNITEYELPKMGVFAKLCQYNDQKEIAERIKKVCPVSKW